MEVKARRVTRRGEQMFPLMERYESYPGTKKQFCQEFNLSQPALGYWLTRYRRRNDSKPSAKKFIPLQVNGQGKENGWRTEIYYADGTRIRFAGEVEEKMLRSFIPLLSK